MGPHIRDGDWRHIAEQVSKEMDSSKLMSLLSELCRALDDKREGKSQVRVHSRNEPERPIANEETI